MNFDLFRGQLVRLAALDPETDAAVESRWSHDVEFARSIQSGPPRPLSVQQVKKRYEQARKEKDQFHFGLRALAEDRLVGLARLTHIEWSHGAAELALGIGEPSDRGKGYGSDALKLLLRYAFGELNLHRVSVWTSDFNDAEVRFLQRAGLRTEVRQRQAIHRDGRRWDRLLLGLLREEWDSSGR